MCFKEIEPVLSGTFKGIQLAGTSFGFNGTAAKGKQINISALTERQAVTQRNGATSGDIPLEVIFLV